MQKMTKHFDFGKRGIFGGVLQTQKFPNHTDSYHVMNINEVSVFENLKSFGPNYLEIRTKTVKNESNYQKHDFLVILCPQIQWVRGTMGWED